MDRSILILLIGLSIDLVCPNLCPSYPLQHQSLPRVSTENIERVVRCADGESAACVAFSPDGRSIAIGHAKGKITVVSTASGTVEMTSSQVVQLDRGVLQIAFLSSRSLVVLDSGGSVYELRQKRGMTGRKREESRCVFSGCNGEVVQFVVINQLHLLFLVSLTKVLIVSTRHGGAVLCAFPVRGPPEAPPIIDYHIESSDVLHLLITRGDRIVLYRILIGRLGTAQKAATQLRLINIETKHPLVQARFHWGSLVTAVDAQERFFAVDLDSATVVEGGVGSEGRRAGGVDDEEGGGGGCSLQCVFATPDYKGLAYGGNVSAAMRCVAENAAYNSFVRAGASIFVLGPSIIYELSVMDEQQQLESYYDRKEYIPAALYLLDLARGKIVPRDPSFLSHIHLRVAECLRLLLEDTVVGVSSGRVAELIAHYRRNIDVLLRVSMGARLFDMLYDEIYPRLEKDGLSRAVILEFLDDYILDGVMERPPPTIVSDYLGNLINEGHFSQLQAAVVRIPIECIDLHKVMTTCRQNGLYDGVIYVMNRALGDYLGPLEEMLDTVASFSSGRVDDLLSDHEVQQGAQLMLYLHCCLAGAAYPIGVLPPDQAATVPVQVYRCITAVRGKDGAGTSSSTSLSALRESRSYPYLRLLLQFDAQQFLHVVCTCADAPLFQSEDNRLQRLTEIVGTLSLECSSASILSEYLRFVANLVATDRIISPGETVNQAIEHLLRMPILTPSEEQSVVEVMRYVAGIDMERVLRLSAKPLRVTICSHIYRLQRRFIDLLKCYLAPPVSTDAFFDVSTRLVQSELTREERKRITEFLKENVEALSSLCSTSTASLVVEHLQEYLIELRRRTIPDTRKRIRERNGEMLVEAFRLRHDRGDRILTGEDDDLDEWLFEMAFEWMCKEGQRSDEELKSLLQYWLPLGSRTDVCLNAVAAAGRTASCVLLMEARGLLTKAFALLIEQLDTAIERADDAALLSYTDEILRFARSHPSETTEMGWLLTLFHKIVEATRRGGNEDEMHNRLLHTVERVLEGGTERAIDIMESLLQYPAFASGTYSEYSSLLSSIISSCDHESRVLHAFARVQHAEGAEALQQLVNLSTRRHSHIVAPECVSCAGPITKASYLYNCGHMQHQDCWSTGKKVCPVCDFADGADRYLDTVDMGSDWEKSSSTVSRRVLFGRDDRRPHKRRNIFDLWDDEPYLGPAGSL